jgi:hypothetical protein
MSAAAQTHGDEDYAFALVRAELQRLSLIFSEMSRQQTGTVAAVSQLRDRVQAVEAKIDNLTSIMEEVRALLKLKL